MIMKTDPVTGAVTWVSGVVVAEEAPKTADTLAGKTIGKAGYDFDPYDSPGEKVEGFFLGRIIGKLTGEADGFISTYREWHIFVQGMYAGFRASTLGAVPECPPLWQDEAQYFEGSAMVTNVIKCQWPTMVAAIGAIGVGSYTGIIPPGTLSSIATSLLGLL